MRPVLRQNWTVDTDVATTTYDRCIETMSEWDRTRVAIDEAMLTWDKTLRDHSEARNLVKTPGRSRTREDARSQPRSRSPPKGQIAPVASSLVLCSPPVAQIAPVASSVVRCSPPVAPMLALRDIAQIVAPMELFAVDYEWQLSSCFEKARHVTIALAETYDFDNKGVVRTNEVIEGFRAIDDAMFEWDTTLGHLVPWNSHTPQPETSSKFMMSEAEQWFRQEVVMTPKDAATGSFVFDNDGPSQTFYHGTIAFCAYSIWAGGGFIPGENGHTKAKRHCKGCFGSSMFDTACRRGDQTRYIDSDGVYSFGSCPVTLELEAKCANLTRYHRHNSQVFVVEGKPGVVLPGVVIKAIWWNKRFVENYRKLTYDRALRAQVVQAGIYAAICGYGRQKEDFSSCGRVCNNPWSDSEFEKVGKYYMCRQCAAAWRWR